MRAIPIIPTILVVAAAGVMVWLGFWQLGRSEEKLAMIERFASIPADTPPISLRPEAGWEEELMFSPVTFNCHTVWAMRSTAGTSASGTKGFAHVAECSQRGAASLEVALGWSRDPTAPEFGGGFVSGVVDASGKIVADPPLAGLQPLAKPNPNDLPNNHLAYAGQWFFFALTALVVYGFALRSRANKHT